ncbi:methyltransferase family protein [Isoptericola sp. CG 20/1183]|uniref:Methyltransferase family protein n=1 Tax=Isoptericola halotolerans TaxID=300560 RepID=A0ABX5EIT9_9MICO|nr:MULTISPECIES: class I SAM-dependent methyltransferase [Isoptericola]PRZ07694.1 methyltransferase family protein [Isoptericola halotolerans]PRZ07947.1 methyltransferase family protein [Isoptericola sp. CG 20/1183]
MQADLYDDYADSYARENASSLLNAHYERPAMIALAGDVRGRRVLDVGCGAGPLTAELRARGGMMTGLDGSPAMVEIARRQLGDDVPLHVADLAAPLPFADAAFDDVVASLVLHYLEDWGGPLAEIRRVLRPGGRLICSVNHPSVRAFHHPTEDYFATRPYTEDFEFAGEPVTVPFWHRPLHAMTDAFTAAGFRIRVVSEPAPSPTTPPELLPPRIATGERTAFLSFLFFVLEADGEGGSGSPVGAS